MSPTRYIVVPALLSIGCAASASRPASSQAVRPMRQRPSVHAMTRALERANTEAMRCLRAGDIANISGEFEGTSGQYQVTRIANASASPLPYAVESCVRVAAERSHVRPFTDESVPFAFSFANTPTAETTASISTTSSASSNNGNIASSVGTMQIEHRATPSDLVRREGDALQRCYEQACERDHTMSGSIELHLGLDADGHITRLTSNVQTPNEDVTLMQLVARCIEAHVRLIQFGPQSAIPTDVTIPITFNPGGIPID